MYFEAESWKFLSGKLWLDTYFEVESGKFLSGKLIID